MKKSALNTITYAAMILILIGVVLQLGGHTLGFVAMCVGAVPFLGVRIFHRWNAPASQHRIQNIFVFSALLIVVSVVAIYFNKRYWILPVLLASMFDLYASFRLKNEMIK